jgi:N-acetylglucosaminyl-diphospho-decaprenol L-rhamnosyltransferase
MRPLDAPISVIVPVHNRADLLAQCLAALARWTTPVEILVVDDGSTDPGVERLRERRLAHHWLRNDEACGFSAAVNRGLARASGDPLLLLNSDAEVTEGGDHAIRDAFASPPDRFGAVGAVAARLVYPNGRPQWSGGAFPSLPWLFALASGLGRGARFRVRRAPPSGFAGGIVDWAPAAALAIRRETFAAVGPFDESYRHYAQDLDYCQRLAATGRSVQVLADWVVTHHLGGSVAAGAEPAAPGSEPASGRPDDATRFDGQRLDLLWLDLLHWAHKHRSPAWARRARSRLLLGGRLRLLRLAIGRPGRNSTEARAVGAALAAITASAPIPAPRGS